MPTMLLTGFLPFGESKSNPSQRIAERLHGEVIAGTQVVGLILPVALGVDFERVTEAIESYQPILVLSLGLAAGTTCLDIERFAVNLKVAEAGDPEAPLPPNLPQLVICAGGPAALFATIDAERVAAAVCEKAGVPVRAHGYAGSYACNYVLYRTLLYAAERGLTYKAGFVHLPLSSEQAISENKLHMPSLPLSAMLVGVRAAIEAALAG